METVANRKTHGHDKTVNSEHSADSRAHKDKTPACTRECQQMLSVTVGKFRLRALGTGDWGLLRHSCTHKARYVKSLSGASDLRQTPKSSVERLGPLPDSNALKPDGRPGPVHFPSHAVPKL
jgi:hypothetical protein